MKEKENAARAGAVQGAEAHAETGTAAPYGKFASADALLQAYNSLEAEFTRRSQRLRELEGRLAASAGAADAAQPAGGGEGGAEAPAGGQSPAEAPARKESVSEEIARAVEAYFAAREKREEAPRMLAGGGAFALAPARKVRTFGEAGELARELFSKNGT